MGRGPYDSYWLHEAFTALEKHGVERPVINGLRSNHAGVVKAAAEVLVKLLELALPPKVRGDAGREKTMPLNVIARGAVVALWAVQDAGVAPPADLVLLIADLMRVDRFMRGSSHAVYSETDAILLIGLIPDITASELAEEAET
jgi:hypothetical protein